MGKKALLKKLYAREVLDSRGNPTIEVEIDTTNHSARAIVPSGTSTGKHEAIELRDKQQRFLGKGVTKAAHNVNKHIQKLFLGKNICNQSHVDTTMISKDNTSNKSQLGANAMVGVSMAVAKIAAKERAVPLYKYIKRLSSIRSISLPVPYANVINGGRHAEGKPAIQEFMIVPSGAKSFQEATRMVSEVYHTLRGLLRTKYGPQAVMVGDQGGFTPHINNTYDAMAILEQAVHEAGYKKKIQFALDAAASGFYNPQTSVYKLDREMSPDELVEFYVQLTKDYPIKSIEDPFDQDDFGSFSQLMQTLTKREKSKIQIVADDLTVTNTVRLKKAIEEKAANALLLKVNQIGTVTEALAAARLALDHGWKVMVSNRSGETEDTFLADLAVGLGCGQIKLGAPCRGERTAKYNRLMRIEEELGKKSRFG